MKNFKLFFIIFLLLAISTQCLMFVHPYALFAQDAKEDEALFVAKKAFEDGFYEVSQGLLERFLQNYPGSPKSAEVNLLIGECYFHQNRYLAALAKFEELLKRPEAKNIKDAIYYWIAEVHFKGNSFSKAQSYYKMIIDEYPASTYIVYAYYSVGWCLYQEHLFSEAVKYFQIVEDKFSKEALVQDAIFKTIECLYSLKDYAALKEKVKYYFDHYPKDQGKTPYLYFYLAESDYYLNDFAGAIEKYSKTFGSQDKKIEALSKLGIGWSYLKLKNYKEAETALLDITLTDLEKASRDILLLAKAILYFETKRIEEAKNIYDELIRTTESPVVLAQAYLGKADMLYNTFDYQNAIEAYKHAQDKVSDSVSQDVIDKVHYGLAWSYLKEGQFKEAIEEFQKIVKFTEDKIVKVAALCYIGDAYQDSGDYNKAVEAYSDILKDYPDSLYGDYVQYQLGLALLKMSNYQGAIMSFSALSANFPESKLLDDASYALGLSYFQQEDYNSSKEIFKNFQEKFKDSNLKPQAIYLLGTSLYNLGQFSEAVETFKDVIRTNSQDLELIQKAEYEIADCYYQKGDEKEAVSRFKALRSKYPESGLTAEIMWWLGEYYYRQNDLSLARRYFSSLIQDFPKTDLIPDAYYAIGSIYSEEADYSSAIENFKKVIQIGKSDLTGQAIIAVADIYLKQNKFDLALQTYQDAAGGYENLANLIYPKIADLYFKIEDYNQAQDYYRKSLDIVPIQEMPDIQFKIAEVQQAQGKMPEAVEEYLKVSYLYSENNQLAIKALLRVAKIYEDREAYKEALNVYEKLVALKVEESKFAQERIDWIKANIK